MDKEQEDMRLLGLFGIYKESYKVIISKRKIFGQITLALILPLSLIYFAHKQVTTLLKNRIHNQTSLELEENSSNTSFTNRISTEWTWYWISKIIYFIFFLLFSLLSVAAVVYTVSSIYARLDLSFRKIISVVPKVWKRLIVTFLSILVAFFIYHVVFLIFFGMWLAFLESKADSTAVLTVILILYSIGFVYLILIWQLCAVISVLENIRGFGAMKKSKQLIKGKLWLGFAIVILPILELIAIQVIFEILVTHDLLGLAGRISFGLLCLVLLMILTLVQLVIQTVVYFVCKSYHHECVDMLALSNRLELYLPGYERLRSERDVQMEQIRV
ncbi:uncharacterized protein LOC124926118 [Impatiens glandulifera]|uniref:uncharacterized protein LOC124926118 n=1 Tax=Impatiens glandulifera TaxID=253017 RepID=UPI001FB15BB7|nr:uncharacterized protein LOC124926118 [Impatiens glandulifera]